MTGLLQDVRYGLRMLWKRPGFTAVAVITLALGIGANTTVFNSVNAMLLRPFPFPHLDRIVTIWETVPSRMNHLSPAPANFRDWSEQSTQFSQLAAVRGWDANLTGGNVAEHVEGSQVTADFFPLLGMSRTIGPQYWERGFPGRGCARGGRQQRILAAASRRRSWACRQAIAPERAEVHRDWHHLSGF